MEEASKVDIFIFIIVLSYSQYVLHVWSAEKLLLIVIEILETWDQPSEIQWALYEVGVILGTGSAWRVRSRIVTDSHPVLTHELAWACACFSGTIQWATQPLSTSTSLLTVSRAFWSSIMLQIWPWANLRPWRRGWCRRKSSRLPAHPATLGGFSFLR